MASSEDEARAAFMRSAVEAADRARAHGAPIVTSIAAAQAALESRYGESQLARDASNLFGIKAGKSWLGDVLKLPTVEYVEGVQIQVMARWRMYPSWEACFSDYGALIARLSWYADAVVAARLGDAEGFLDGLLVRVESDGDVEEPGWSTDPNYRDKVIAIARRWQLMGVEA